MQELVQPAAGPTLEQIRRLQVAIPEVMDTLNIEELTRHVFLPGVYIRELRIPKGSVIVGKQHKEENLFVLAQGELHVSTEAGMKTIRAPYYAITRPGEKRVAYAIRDSVTLNVHQNLDDEKDLAVLEARYIIDETPAIEHARQALIEDHTT